MVVMETMTCQSFALLYVVTCGHDVTGRFPVPALPHNQSFLLAVGPV